MTGREDYILRGYNWYYCDIIIKIKPKKEPMRKIFHLTYIKIEQRPRQIKSVSDLFGLNAVRRILNIENIKEFT